MTYTIKLITTDEKEQMDDHFMSEVRYELKSEIYGCCIKFLSDNHLFRETWQENFYPMCQNIRSHGRLFVFNDTGYPQNTVFFDPYSKTAFLLNFSYYGWVKSIALAIAGDILEDEHDIFSLHGACVDLDGKGLCMVGTSGAGKTTQTYGLLTDPHTRIISDDWFFSRVFGLDILGYGSEKNFYIRDDLTTIWKEYGGLAADTEYDADRRAVADIRWIIGKGRLLPLTTIRTIVILKRDPADPAKIQPLTPGAAQDIILRNNYFNPHLLVVNERKTRLRNRFIADLLGRTTCYLVNTTGTPRETQKIIRSRAGLEDVT
ncbi:MAG: aldolase [Methanoregula sp.]|jgi:hypothetical protein